MSVFLFIALTLLATLLFRKGWFAPLAEYKEARLLDQSISIVGEEATWEDMMSEFRRAHPHLRPRTYLSLRSPRRR